MRGNKGNAEIKNEVKIHKLKNIKNDNCINDSQNKIIIHIDNQIINY